jgi:hypothetical protein
MSALGMRSVSESDVPALDARQRADLEQLRRRLTMNADPPLDDVDAQDDDQEPDDDDDYPLDPVDANSIR